MPAEPRFGKILCAVDFSDCSCIAARHAIGLARGYRSELTALHVMPHTLTHPDLFPYLDQPLLVSPEIRARVNQRLEAFIRDHLAESETPVRAVLEAGDTARQIVRHIARGEADLVVMGTHGRRGFRRWLLGSVADDVLRRALGCILVVGQSSRGQPFPYRRIVCCVDFSEASLTALEHAASLATSGEGELLVLHVVESGEGVEDGGVAPSREEVLRRLGGELSSEFLSRVEFVSRKGTPHEQIREFATARNADLVVAGASGRGAVNMLLFGSTVSQVVRTAETAVLVVGSTTRESRQRVLADLDAEAVPVEESQNRKEAS
jgi:nucleotide-binding universal stress UspA family protein